MPDNEAIVPLLHDQDGVWPSENPGYASPNNSSLLLLDGPSPTPNAPRLSDLDAPSAPADESESRRKLHRPVRSSSFMSSAGQSIVSIVDEYYPEGSIKGSIFNLCSATLGAGCLSVPYAFRGMGIGVGLGLLVLVACMTSFSVHLIIVTRLRSGLRSYGEIAEGVFGAAFGMAVEFSVVLFCFGTGVAYCKTLRDILDPVLTVLPTYVTGGLDDKSAMMVVWVTALLPISCLKSMSALRFSSLLGVASIVYVSGCVTVHCLINLASGKVKPKWTDIHLWIKPSINDITLALPILLFAFTCQVNVLDVWDDLTSATHARMSKVTHRSMVLCLLIYVSVGLFGFLEFGKHTCGNILKSYEVELLDGSLTVIGMYIFIALTLLFAFPLIVLPCRSSLMSIATRLTGHSGNHLFWTLLVAGGAVAISLWVEDVSEVFQLVGASSSALVCFVFPPAAALKLGVLKGRDCFFAWVLLVGGVLVGVLGTYVTLIDIAHPSGDDLKC